MKTVILTGGKGTRLGQSDIPKAMQKIGDRVVLEHQILLLKRYGLKDILLITGHLHEKIEDYFGDGRRWGVSIKYYKEEKLLGTAGALKAAENELKEDFILLYGDIMLDLNFHKLLEYHRNKNSFCTCVVHPNDHPHDSDLIDIDDRGRIINFFSKPHNNLSYYRNLANSALYITSGKITHYIPPEKKLDLARDILPTLILQEKNYAYRTREYLKDMGSPERLKAVERDFRTGRIGRRNINNKLKAIFIDRDGVINRDIGFLHKAEDFELLENTGKALRMINESEYLAVLVTNQSVIARNLCSISELQEIHNKMEFLLGAHNAMFDAIYYCPHHPDRGYPEENAQYKIACHCRKPAPGMIKQAQADMNIMSEGSFIIGDSESDIVCGNHAGLHTVFIGNNNRKFPSGVKPDYTAPCLLQAVEMILCKG